jgi:RND family efflux transporter MFP subunit
MRPLRIGFLIGSVVCSALISGTIVGCGDGEAADAVTESRAIRVTVSRPRTVWLSPTVVRPGRVDANSVVPLGFQDGGRVQSVAVDENDNVVRGQRLAWLDTTEVTANVRKARTGVEKAERDHQRAVRLAREAAIPSNTAIDAKSALDLAHATLFIAKHHLHLAILRAPTSGNIVRRLIEPGQLVGKGTPALILMELNPIKIVAGITDVDLVRVHKGDSVVVTISALPEFIRTGIVNRTGLVAATDGMFPVEVTMPNPDLVLRPGMIAQVAIRTNGKTAVLTVPAPSVVVGADDISRVYVLDPATNRVARCNIRTGPPHAGRMPVYGGLKEDELVVVDGARDVRDGMKVKVVTRGGGS